MAERILTSAYGRGPSSRVKLANTRLSDPEVLSIEDVAAGNGAGNATPLSLIKTVSTVTTATNSSHVSLADGVTGQVKVIVHKTQGSGVDLVITPANFANGTKITSDSPSRSITLCFDGTNWQVIAGEITGTAEMVITTE